MTTRAGSPALIGESGAMRQLREMIARVAPARIPVLVQGETGVGKEMVARALHQESGRPGRLVAFNVCAIGDSMFEDALFGHVRGAFTGAVHDAPGFLVEAHRGTVFLDEIGGLPLAGQVKLLRAIETGVFRPVGGRQDVASEFRVVAAMNQPLPDLVARGEFRRDLAQRLSGVVLHVPPLAARAEDVPLLLREFLRQAGEGCVFSGAAVARLQEHDWPGNVRELRHVVEAIAALHAGATVGRAEVESVLRMNCADELPAPALGFATRRLVGVMEQAGWNVARAAEVLGVHRATLYRRLRRLGIVTEGTGGGYLVAACRRVHDEVTRQSC